DCGGPIVDLNGRVIGINICRAGRTESWAVPGEVVLPLLADLMSGKLAPPSAVEEAAKLTLENVVANAKAALEKAERDKNRVDKDFTEAKKAVLSAEANLKDYRAKETTESADKLTGLMKQRLLAMNDVAG